MTVNGQSVMTWLVSSAGVLALLVLGRPLLVPLAFAILIWSLLNALTGLLRRYGFPAWLAWASSLIVIAGAVFLAARIFVEGISQFADAAPGYVAKLEKLTSNWPSFFNLGLPRDASQLLRESNLTHLLTTTAASVGKFLFGLVGVAVYTFLLLVEQRTLPAKLDRLSGNHASHHGRRRIIGDIAAQVQVYLGVATLMSLMMGIVSFAILSVIGVPFAGLWALFMFVLTYIPYIGAFGVLLPAVVGFAQLGTFEAFFIVGGVLGATHLVLMNIVETVMLGRTLNLSLLAIFLSLSFWGLIWGIAGLFLAVPIVGALVIVCRHIDGFRWVAVVLARPEPGDGRRRPAK